MRTIAEQARALGQAVAMWAVATGSETRRLAARFTALSSRDD